MGAKPPSAWQILNSKPAKGQVWIWEWELGVVSVSVEGERSLNCKRAPLFDVLEVDLLNLLCELGS